MTSFFCFSFTSPLSLHFTLHRGFLFDRCDAKMQYFTSSRLLDIFNKTCECFCLEEGLVLTGARDCLRGEFIHDDKVRLENRCKVEEKKSEFKSNCLICFPWSNQSSAKQRETFLPFSFSRQSLNWIEKSNSNSVRLVREERVCKDKNPMRAASYGFPPQFSTVSA